MLNKDTDLSGYSQEQLDAIADEMNNRPRNWMSMANGWPSMSCRIPPSNRLSSVALGFENAPILLYCCSYGKYSTLKTQNHGDL